MSKGFARRAKPFSLVSSDEEITPGSTGGKKKSFSMRLSEGKQILERKRLKEKEIGKK